MFTNITKYGIRAVLYLARQDKRMKSSEISKDLEISDSFMKKLLQKLAKAEIISSVKGPNGGVFLSDENKQKTLYDVVQCLQPSNVFEKCALDLVDCSDRNPCPLHKNYSILKMGIEDMFKTQSIEYINDNLDGAVKI